MNKDPFKTDKPLIDHRIKFDTSNLPKHLKELIKELEKYDKEGDWFNYDIIFDRLEIDAKSCLINKQITEYEYTKILNKYGWLYD